MTNGLKGSIVEKKTIPSWYPHCRSLIQRNGYTEVDIARITLQ